MRLHSVFLPLALMLCSVSVRAQLTWEFVNELSDGNVVEVNAVKTDVPRSCVYIVGSFSSDLSSSFTFGLNGTPDFSSNYGGTDGFVAKYDDSGNFIWAFMIGGVGADEIMDLEVDASGSVYITGSFTGSAEFRGTEVSSFPNVTSFGSIDAFYAKYDSDGKFQWIHEDGGAGDDQGSKLEIINSTLVVAGVYESSGVTEIADSIPVAYGGKDIFLIGSDLNGVSLWNASGGSDDDDWIGGLAGESDSIYVAVNFTGNTMSYTDFTSIASPGQLNTLIPFVDVSIVSFGLTTGSYGWVRELQGASNDYCFDMIANTSQLVLCGSYSGALIMPSLGTGPFTMGLSYDAYTLGLDHDGGDGLWFCAEQTVGMTDAHARSLDFDQSGNIIVGGDFIGQLSIRSSYVMNSIAGADLFTIGYDGSGNYLFHDSASSVGIVDLNDLSVNGSNHVFYVGKTNSNTEFTPLSTTISGIQDGFLAKLGSCDATFSYSSSSYCFGNPNPIPTVSGDPGGTFSETSGNIAFADPLTGEIDLSASTIGGPYDVTYTVAGGCQEIQQITISSNSSPVFTFCPTTINALSAPGSCDTLISYSIPVATDDCGTVSIVQTDLTGYSSGDNFPVGTTTLEYTATDLAGNTAVCVFDVVVADVENPVFTFCPANISQGNNLSTCGASVTFSTPTASDNCSVSVSQISGLASGATFPVDTTLNRFVATDAFGNTDTCSFLVIVEDVEAPSITCPSDIIQSNDPGLCSAVVNYSVPTGTDNCFVDSTWISLGDSSGASFPVGPPITVEYFVQDAAGLQGSCSFTITVVDTTGPSLTCPSDTTLANDSLSCDAVFSYSIPFADNCSASSLSQLNGLPSGSAFPLGSTINEFSVVDASSNSSTCSFTVTVIDTIAPVTNCFPDTILFNDSGSCGAIFNYTLPSANDNCDTAFSINFTGLPSGSLFPIGSTQLEFVIEDNSGNKDTCDFMVTVMDVEAPVIQNCPPDTVLSNDPGICGAVYSYLPIVATDNCLGSITPSQIDTTGYSSGDVFPVGTTVLSFAVIDSSGNGDTCSFSITVNDTETPQLVCIPDTTILNNTDTCGAFFSYSMPTAMDNCDTVLTVNQIDTSGYASGDFFPIGSTELIYSVSDAVGNSDTCSFVVTVLDTAAPIISCLSDTTLFNNPDSCGAVYSFSMPDAFDNCTVDFDTIKLDTSGYVSGDLFPVGSTEISYAYRDPSGNADTCSFNVTVIDIQPPLISCVPDTVLSNDLDSCGAFFSYSIPIAADNCAVQTITQIAGYPPGSSFYPVDTIVNTFVAIDLAGNSDTCSFQVIVQDDQAPNFNNSSQIVDTVAGPGRCGFYAIYDTSFTDNCFGGHVVATDSLGFDIPVTGSGLLSSYVIDLTVYDAVGNTNTGTVTYFIQDIEPPVISLCANDTAYSSPVTCGAIVSYEAPNAVDNCGVDSVYTLGSIPPSPSFFAVGDHNIDWIVVDDWGNSTTCTQTITILDTIGPFLICPSDTVLCDSVFHYPEPIYSDSCGIRSLTTSIGSTILPNNSVYTFPVGVTGLKYTVLDLDSNMNSCVFNIEVLPPIFPHWDTLPSQLCLQADTIDLRSLRANPIGFFSGPGVISSSDFLAQLAGVGLHNITYTVSNVACSKDSTYPIEVLPNPDISAGIDDSVCGLEYMLEGETNMGGFWYSDSILIDNETDINSVCNSPGYGTYQLIWEITGPPSCEASDTVLITFDQQITSYAGEDQYILELLETNLNADSVLLGSGYWNLIFGSGEVQDMFNPNSEFFPSTFGIYELEWITQNGSCPPVIDEVILEFKEIAIPEGLSPNQDGLNDEFIVPGIAQFSTKEIKIYDRWGKLVFQDSDYNNDWKGTNMNEERLIDDTYFYEITLDGYQLTGFLLIKSN